MRSYRDASCSCSVDSLLQRLFSLLRTSVVSTIDLGVEPFESSPRIFGSELPVDSGVCRVALLLPHGGSLFYRLSVGNPTTECLSRYHALLDLRHVWARPVLGQAVDFEPLGQQSQAPLRTTLQGFRTGQPDHLRFLRSVGLCQVLSVQAPDARAVPSRPRSEKRRRMSATPPLENCNQ